MSESKLHCWKTYNEYIAEQVGFGTEVYWANRRELNATCMLLDQHKGPHEFTSDDEIRVTLTAEL